MSTTRTSTRRRRWWQRIGWQSRPLQLADRAKTGQDGRVRATRVKAAAYAERVVDVGGRATRMLSGGSGRAVVWLHDSPGNDWSAGHAAVARGREVIAPWLPGAEDSRTLGGVDT